uniref:Uncharacterized protein n=1 Tax=uncultured alpha proteobacterium HF0130_06E21 TaxID=710808 RepID=E0XT24_9PROT|nr:hypothetical protein [uncultured alpha proteobacterium HF0130_06E21]
MAGLTRSVYLAQARHNLMYLVYIPRMRVQADVFDVTHRRLRIPSSGIHNVQQRRCRNPLQ